MEVGDILLLEVQTLSGIAALYPCNILIRATHLRIFRLLLQPREVFLLLPASCVGRPKVLDLRWSICFGNCNIFTQSNRFTCLKQTISRHYQGPASKATYVPFSAHASSICPEKAILNHAKAHRKPSPINQTNQEPPPHRKEANARTNERSIDHNRIKISPQMIHLHIRTHRRDELTTHPSPKSNSFRTRICRRLHLKRQCSPSLR